MQIEGYSEDQIKAICTMWKLGSPINVGAFLDRSDIPDECKNRVQEVGECKNPASDAEAANAYRLMVAQIIIEVVRLDKQAWNPMGASKGE